jgi:hypothetical protein
MGERILPQSAALGLHTLDADVSSTPVDIATPSKSMPNSIDGAGVGPSPDRP